MADRESVAQEVRRLVTMVFVSVVIGLGEKAAQFRIAKKIVADQNLDGPLAERLIAQFQQEHGLQDVPFKAVKQHADAGFYPLEGPSGRVQSVVDPASVTHEFGHALSRKKDHLSAHPGFRFTTAWAGRIGTFIAAATGHPWIAGLVAALSATPVLLEEWRASDYAREFLKNHVPKEEAERAGRMLDNAFRTYLITVAGRTLQGISAGYFSRRMKAADGNY